MKPSDYIRKGWCQGYMARDSNGAPCDPAWQEATYWCLWGALYKAYGEEKIDTREKVVTKLYDQLQCKEHWSSLGTWNDNTSRTQQDVIALLKSIGE